MSSSDTTDVVDDTNPRVQYQPGWIWDQGVAEVDATRHGAATAGLSCWLSFTGTGVQVVGTLGPSDTDGQPTTAYSIDGVSAGTYSAPFVPPGTTRYNITFFAVHNLSAGDHIIRINNTNGTSPNVFWLDYFLIDGSPDSQAPSPTPSSSQSSGDPQAPNTPSSSVSSITAGLSPSSSVGNAVSPGPASLHSASHLNIGAIVGGVVGGVVVVAIIAVLSYCLVRERRRAAKARSVVPFDVSQTRSGAPSPTSLPRRASTGLESTKNSSGAMTEYGGTIYSSVSPPSALSTTGTRSLVAQPSEPMAESVANQPSSPSSSRNASAATPSGRSRQPISSLSEKARSSSPLQTAVPPLSSNSSPVTAPEQSPASSGVPTPASALFPTESPLLPPAAIIPPGIWHAPPSPTAQSRAQSLLRLFFSRDQRAGSDRSTPAAFDVDSGLRLYDPVIEPPPYTSD